MALNDHFLAFWDWHLVLYSPGLCSQSKTLVCVTQAMKMLDLATHVGIPHTGLSPGPGERRRPALASFPGAICDVPVAPASSHSGGRLRGEAVSRVKLCSERRVHKPTRDPRGDCFLSPFFLFLSSFLDLSLPLSPPVPSFFLCRSLFLFFNFYLKEKNVFWPHRTVCSILVPQPRTEPGALSHGRTES